MAIIGYGKLGGLELTYSSDLDLVLLHNGFSMGHTTGERSQYNDVFYTRFGQRIIHILTTQTRAGDLYDLDMRYALLATQVLLFPASKHLVSINKTMLGLGSIKH